MSGGNWPTWETLDYVGAWGYYECISSVLLAFGGVGSFGYGLRGNLVYGVLICEEMRDLARALELAFGGSEMVDACFF